MLKELLNTNTGESTVLDRRRSVGVPCCFFFN